jgi:hypothetical protein
MMKSYMTSETLTKGKKPEGDPGGKAATSFPREESVISIYGRLAPHESRRKLKLMGQTVNTLSPTISEYL